MPDHCARRIVPSVILSSGSPEPGMHLLVVGDELDMASAPQLRAAAGEVLRDPPRMLVVDLAGVSFMASAGVNALLGIHEDVAAAGCRLVLVAAPRAVMRVIEMARLDGVFVQRDCLASAIGLLHDLDDAADPQARPVGPGHPLG